MRWSISRAGAPWSVAGLWLAIITPSIVLATASASAVVVAPVPFSVETRIWLLNGDPARQPLVPRVQPLAVPTFSGTESLVVTPTLAVPAALGGSHPLEVFQTTGGQGLRFPNPRAPTDPFTPRRLTLQLENAAGLLAPGQGSGGGFGGDLPLRLRLRIPLHDNGANEVFVVELPPAGTLSFGAHGTTTFQGEISLLLDPVSGTARGTGWTTGRSTVAERCFVRPPRTCPAPDFTVTSTGSLGPHRLSLVTPIVIDSFWGRGADRVPLKFLGFSRLTLGVQVPEPDALPALIAALLALAWPIFRRRGRTLPAPADTLATVDPPDPGTAAAGSSSVHPGSETTSRETDR